MPGTDSIGLVLRGIAAASSIPEEKLLKLAGLLSNPPAGSLSPEDMNTLLAQACPPEKAALLLAILLATDFRRHGELPRELLHFLLPRESCLDEYDRGRLWHIAGFFAWRLDEDMVAAHTALDLGLNLLTPLPETQAKAYLGRVWNTFAQLMHHQGRFHEARFGFETALHYRKLAGEPIDLAFTLGNLARVCIDSGDQAAAVDFLQQDLDICRSIDGVPVHVEIQLLSELAACHLLLHNTGMAQKHYLESEALAIKHHEPVGLVFANLGLGRVALAQTPADLAGSRYRLDEVHRLLATPDIPSRLHPELEALAHELHGDILTADGSPVQAITTYELARRHFEMSSTTIPREIAQLHCKIAQAHLSAGNEMQGAMILRTALSRIDATALDDQRAHVESLLRERFPQIWMLHSAGRFIGQKQIDYFLEQTGRRGFHGSKQEMLVLFSDIRGFTRISETLSPDALIGLLNDYLARMTRSIEHYGGMVDKFIGDAIMAIFPDDDPARSCRNGVMAALLMQAELTFLNRELAAQNLKLEAGIGLHFGTLVCGLIGSPQKRSYTVIGDIVNSASRLEGMTKQLGAGILISENVAGQLPPEEFLLRPLGSYKPKGSNEPIGVFDLMGMQNDSIVANDCRVEIDQCRTFTTLLEDEQPDAALALLESLATNCAHPKRSDGYRKIAGIIRRQKSQDPQKNGYKGMELTEK